MFTDIMSRYSLVNTKATKGSPLGTLYIQVNFGNLVNLQIIYVCEGKSLMPQTGCNYDSSARRSIKLLKNATSQIVV